MKKPYTRKKPRNTCGWCGLDGHYEPGCHVKAEGRREPDAHDRIAAALVAEASPKGGTRIDGQAMRAAIAAHLRGGDS